MDQTEDDGAETGSEAAQILAKTKRLLDTRERVTKRVIKRARKIKAVFEDLPPYPGND